MRAACSRISRFWYCAACSALRLDFNTVMLSWEGTGRGLGRAAAATVAHAGTLTIAQTHDEKAEIE